MIRNLVKREIRGRYKGSILGFLWNFITPLIQIVVYIIVFTAIFKPGIDNYPFYLISGIMIWNWFAESVVEGSGTFVGNGDMLKKIYFPRVVLPIAVILSKLVNFLIMVLLYFIIVAISGYNISVEGLLCLPIVIVITFFFILGIVLITSAINVYLRDVQYILSVLMMAWIWMTPIMYSSNGIDSPLINAILTYNPMTYVVSLYQSIFYWCCAPSISDLVITIVLAVILMLVGAVVFKVLEKDFAEVL